MGATGCGAQNLKLDETFERMLSESVKAMREKLPEGWPPQILITLGSGLGDLAHSIADPVAIPYTEIPHLRPSTAPGHAGKFIAGELEGVRVLCMQGRLHPYEGYSPLEATYPVRIASRLGADTLVVTNATGAINPLFHPGQVVLVTDHINLTGQNPLVGPNLDAEGPRFPDMTHAYTPRLRKLAHNAADSFGYDLQEGVYIGVSGPSFETPAEIRAFRALGADLVGMSTVWEVIVAVHCGMEVLGLSMATNMAAGMLDEPISTAEIDAAAAAGTQDMQSIVRGVLQRLR